MSSKLELRRTGERGFGLYVKEFVPRGSLIHEYLGEVINTVEMMQRLEEYTQLESSNFYILTVGRDSHCDAGRKGSLARFLNHSCDPNCFSRLWEIPGQVPREGLYAKYDLHEGTELTFDYLMEAPPGSEHLSPVKCLCESIRCSGFLTRRAVPRTTKWEIQVKQMMLNVEWSRRVYDRLVYFVTLCHGIVISPEREHEVDGLIAEYVSALNEGKEFEGCGDDPGGVNLLPALGYKHGNNDQNDNEKKLPELSIRNPQGLIMASLRGGHNDSNLETDTSYQDLSQDYRNALRIIAAMSVLFPKTEELIQRLTAQEKRLAGEYKFRFESINVKKLLKMRLEKIRKIERIMLDLEYMCEVVKKIENGDSGCVNLTVDNNSNDIKNNEKSSKNNNHDDNDDDNDDDDIESTSPKTRQSRRNSEKNTQPNSSTNTNDEEDLYYVPDINQLTHKELSNYLRQFIALPSQLKLLMGQLGLELLQKHQDILEKSKLHYNILYKKLNLGQKGIDQKDKSTFFAKIEILTPQMVQQEQQLLIQEKLITQAQYERNKAHSEEILAREKLHRLSSITHQRALELFETKIKLVQEIVKKK
jgi:hypothetical protein